MAKSIEGTIVGELTNLGQRTVVDVSGVDQFAASAANFGSMGSAVVELVMLIGNIEVSYSPVKLLNASTSSISPSTVDGVARVAFVVTTEDGTSNDLVIAYYGEETQ